MTSFKRSFGGFFTKKFGKNAISHEFQQFCTIVQSGKFISTIFVFLELAFRMTVRIFRVVMQNQFSLFPFELRPNSPLVQFARLCEFSACLCEIEKHSFSTPFCHFFHFFLLITLQPPSNPGPNQLHYFFHCPFGSSSTLFVLFNLIHLFCHKFIQIIP